MTSPDGIERPKRVRSSPYVRHILESDFHGFVGRIYDLSIVGYYFESYEDLAKHPDCKYAIDVNYDLSGLTARVESLNLVGDLLWPEPIPDNFSDFPVSRYQWLTISADVFLMRYVSVVDCAMILVNTVYEVGLDPRGCTLRNLKNHIPPQVADILQEMHDDQGSLRPERNRRMHHGAERLFTQDDLTFRTAAQFECNATGLAGHDRFGRRINVKRSFKEGLVGIQRDFNRVTRRLVRQLDRLYDELWVEFDKRFDPKICAATHGLNGSQSAHRG